MRVVLSVVMVLSCAVLVSAQGVVFYDGFETADTSGWWAAARARETGQVTCYDAAGAVIACPGTAQDGAIRGGVPWPNPRFTGNLNGTVTDNLTGLVWLKDAACFYDRTWAQALTDAATLANGACGLTDGSAAGDWRLPSVNEMQSLFDHEYWGRAVPNTTGTGKWTSGDPFLGVQGGYWSSSSLVSDPAQGWAANTQVGIASPDVKTLGYGAWPVRGGGAPGWWAPARVSETGETACYDESGAVISCAGTGQDGDLRPGVGWPNPRFVDNGNGTVTDKLTGLVWLRLANCFTSRTWVQALSDASALASGACGLTDGSAAGSWRLPSVSELHSMVAYGYANPALSNAAGTGRWTEGDPFSGVHASYWSSTSYAYAPTYAYYESLYDGVLTATTKATGLGVWPVRGVR
jgi:hypothetical protein